MGTALQQYFGIITAMDCSGDIINAGFFGFIGGALLAWLIGMILDDMKK